MRTVEKIYNDSDEFFNDLIEAIQQAKSSIFLETYIFDIDSLGKRIINVLLESVKKGVQVHVLIDGIGSSHWSFAEAENLRKQGIHFDFFHPLIWQKVSISIWQYFNIKEIIKNIYKLNRRNHRKTCVIDNRILFVSSMNISDRHLKSVHHENAWRDTAVCIQANDVQNILKADSNNWIYSKSFFGKRLIQFLRKKRKQNKDLIQNFSTAKKLVWITNPYFVPNFLLSRAILKAAKNGCDVKILVPNRSDIIGMKFVIEGFYTALLKVGCEIYEYKPSILHAKVLIIDDWARVGSTNLDNRSIIYNLEADVEIQKKENIDLLKQHFLSDLKVSHQITLKDWNLRPWYQSVLQKIFLIFRGVF